MDSIERLINSLKNGSAKAAEQIGLIDSESPTGLGPFRSQAATALIEALAHQNDAVRFEAAWALTSFDEYVEHAAPPLVRLLNDPCSEVRSQAAETLGTIGVTQEFVSELVEALANGDRLIRRGVVDALEHLGPDAREAVSVLNEMLADSNRDFRQGAANALGEIGADATAAVPLLFGLVLTEDTETQTTIVEAVVKICEKSPSAAQVLRELLTASGDQLQGSAAIALREAARLY